MANISLEVLEALERKADRLTEEANDVYNKPTESRAFTSVPLGAISDQYVEGAEEREREVTKESIDLRVRLTQTGWRNDPVYRDRVRAAYRKIGDASAIADANVKRVEADSYVKVKKRETPATQNSATAAGDIENTDPGIIKSPLLKNENKNLEDAQSGTNDGVVVSQENLPKETADGALDYPGQPGVGGQGAITEGGAIGPDFGTPAGTDLTLDNIGVNAKMPDFQGDLTKALPNELHGFASYTYGLSLALLSKEEYNTIVNDGEYTPNRVLIASAGRYDNTQGPNQFIRAPYFDEDFYFDGLTIETVIGLNAESRDTNAISHNFTIIEPYGFTLMDRIIELCSDPKAGVNSKNYIDMPYLLQIDFFGMDESGEITGIIPQTTKRIPIRLNKMDSKITAKGAEYKFEGVPYNHSAYTLSTITTPANFEVEASTVLEFFNSQEDLASASLNAGDRESGTNGLRQDQNGRLIGPDGQFVPLNTINPFLLGRKTRKQLGLIRSFGAALNQYLAKAQANNKTGHRDVIHFKFAKVDIEGLPDIENSPFYENRLSFAKDTGMADRTSPSVIARANLGEPTSSYRAGKRIFQVNAGTYIDKVIMWIVRNSTWMASQIDGLVPDGVTDMDKFLREYREKENKPVYWIKIVPEVRLLEYDPVRNSWARDITYVVRPYEVRNVKVPFAPQAKAKYPVKEYNYIYTGRNVDIIDLDIQFNALYYTTLTTYRNALSKTTTPADKQITKKVQNVKADNPDRAYEENAIMPLVNKLIVEDTRSITGSGSSTPTQVALSDLEDSLHQMSTADMLNVKLRIIGDPSLIKQDDIFWSPTADGTLNAEVGDLKSDSDPRLTYDGSLKMDNGEVYCQLNFTTPTDIDEETGLMKFDSNMRDSKFSGLYRIMKVTNNFRDGKFEQDLDLIRLHGQKTAQQKAKKSNNTNRTSDLVPGQAAILDQYMLSPYNATPDNEKITNLEAEIGMFQPGQIELADVTTEPLPLDKNQKALANILDNADTVVMTEQNQPLERSLTEANPFAGVTSGADAPSQQGSFG